MIDLLKASTKGLEIVDRARKRRGWTKTNTACWWQDAHTSRATLRRFWHGDRIQRDIFIGICQAVGISDWEAIVEPIEIPEIEEIEPRSPQLDWDEDAPDIGQFFGRQVELEQLVRWIEESSCRLVAITGLAGMGKTALAVALVERLNSQFERTQFEKKLFEKIIWRSLQAYSTLPQLLENLLYCFNLQSVQNTKENTDRLIQELQKHRCLLILDGWETVCWHPNSEQGYNDFLHRLSRDRHPGCLLLTSREKPQMLDWKFNSGIQSKTRCLNLKGLDTQDAIALLESQEIAGTNRELAALSQFYGGNPLALQMGASLIRSVFGDNIEMFLSQKISMTDRFKALLQHQLDRLSVTEREIAYWLAIWQEPISFCRLQTHILNVSTADLVLEGILGLERYAFLEKHFSTDEPSFTLPPLVMQVVTTELLEKVAGEISQAIQSRDVRIFEITSSHLLLRPGTDDLEGDRLLPKLLNNLWQVYGSSLSELLQELLSLLADRSPRVIGYARYNLAALLNRIN